MSDWQPMDKAPKDGTPILARIRPDLAAYRPHYGWSEPGRFAGLYVVIRHQVSIGVEWCPLIGVQKGPLWRCGEQARGGVAFQLAQPTRACVLEGGQARVLMRQLSLPVSTMSQWWVRRSSSAVVIFASPKTVGHSPNARLVVTMTEVCS